MKGRSESCDLFLIRSLRHLMKAGLPLADGIRQWAVPLAPRAWAEPLDRIAENLNQGKSLHEAVQASGFPLSPNISMFLERVEKTDRPEPALQILETSLLQEEKIRLICREVFVYPCCVLLVMACVMVFYAFTLLEALYQQHPATGRPLPLILYSILHPIWPIWLLLIPAAALVCARILKDPLRFTLPFLRNAYVEVQRALLCQLLELELKMKKTLSEAMDLASRVAPEEERAHLEGASQQIRRGLRLAAGGGRLLTTQIRFVLASSGTGEIAIRYLSRLREYHLEQARSYAASLRNTMQIWLLVILGTLVGIVVCEIFQIHYGYIVGKLTY